MQNILYFYLYIYIFNINIAISSILDTLEDMQYLTDYFDTDCNFLDEIFDDLRLEELKMYPRSA